MRAWVEKGARLHKSARLKTSSLSKNSVQKILIIRHAALGDMLQTRPFLVELKKCFPSAQVTLSLISNYQYGAPIDLVDQVHVLPGRDQKKIPFMQKIASLRYFKNTQFDLLFDLANTSRSYLLSLLTSATLKLSFPYRNMRWPYDVAIFRSDFRFEAENLCEFLFYFGHQPKFPLDFSLPVNLHYKTQKKVLCFFGASNPNRCYPIASWGKILPVLADQFKHLEFLVLDGQAHWEKYDSWVKNLKKENIKSVPHMNLADLQGLMLSSHAVFSNDTGIRHLALATHTPTCAFFTNTCPGRNLPTYEFMHHLLMTEEGDHMLPESAIMELGKFLTSLST